MKRILSAIAVVSAAMVFAVTASAQKPRVGVLVGFTSSNADVSQFDASSVSLYHAGLAFNFPVGVGFAIQPQLLYQVKGASLDEIHTVQDVSSQSSSRSRSSGARTSWLSARMLSWNRSSVSAST